MGGFGVGVASLLLATSTQDTVPGSGVLPSIPDPLVLAVLEQPAAVDLPDWSAPAASAAPAGDGSVRVMAIPEDLRLETNRGGGSSFEAVVDIVQPVGSDIFLDLDVSGDPITARVEANAKVNGGDRLRFTPVPGRVPAFDTDTGTTIL